MKASSHGGLLDRSATAVREDVVAIVRNSLWLQGGLALMIHAWLGPLVLAVGTLPRSAYAQPVLTWELIRDPGRRTILGACCLLLLLLRGHASWKSLDLGRHARLFVMGAAALLVWPFSTLDYNFFFDQGYIVDRFILVGLWALIYLHPFFVVPVLIVLSMMIGQLLHPLPEGWWHWPDKKLPFDFLIMFCAFLATRAFFRRHRDVFVLLTCTVVASQYFHAALNKILLGPYPWTWATENHLSHIFVGAHVNGGWLRQLSPTAIHRVSEVLSALDPALAAATLMVEGGAILLLLRRRLLPWILIAEMALHVGILSLTGIFFWKWILFDLMLALWLWRSWPVDDVVSSGPPTVPHDGTRTGSSRQWFHGRGLFSAHGFAVFVILVLGSKLSFRNVPFAWWDTPYINFFEIRGIGQSGTEYVLDSRFFSPYDMLVHQARFHYLKQSGVVGGTFAVAHDYEFARAVETAAPDDMDALRNRFGVRADPAWAASSTDAFTVFVSQYVTNVTRHGGKHWWLNWFAPPYHFQTSRPENAYDLQEPLRHVYVQHREFLDWQGALHDVGSERVLEIPMR
jgi:hypothetical protein